MPLEEMCVLTLCLNVVRTAGPSPSFLSGVAQSNRHCIEDLFWSAPKRLPDSAPRSQTPAQPPSHPLLPSHPEPKATNRRPDLLTDAEAVCTVRTPCACGRRTGIAQYPSAHGKSALCEPQNEVLPPLPTRTCIVVIVFHHRQIVLGTTFGASTPPEQWM